MKKLRIFFTMLAAMLILTACGEKEIKSSGERVREERSESKVSDETEEPDENEEPDEIEEPEEPEEYEHPQDLKELSEGDKAPDFTAELCDGGSFTLSDHKDKVVLINFWATWCGPCVREMPAFERLKADGIDGFELICVNCLEDKDTVDSFVADEGYTFNIAYDVDGDIIMKYPTDGIPYTLIVDHGVISKIYVGAGDADYQYNEYKSAIEEALK